MSKVLATKMVGVMKHVGFENEAEFAVFKSTYDDTGVAYRQVNLKYDDWADLGRPSQITVTVEPMDKLNG